MLIDDDLSHKLSYFEFRIIFNNGENRFDIDIDDLSMAYKRGYIEKVLVDTDSVSCYEAGSDIHIHSSTMYNNYYSNSFTATITDVDEQPEGTYCAEHNYNIHPSERLLFRETEVELFHQSLIFIIH